MTIQSSTYLKGKFETGDKPAEADFSDWIDSFVHLSETLGGYSVLIRNATSGNATGLTIPFSSFLGRKASGDIVALSISDVQSMIGSGIPSGAINAYAGPTAPTGWLLCDGSAISRTTYATLFTSIGATYGEGDGSTTFNVPDLRGRAPVGADGTHALGVQFGAATFDATHNHDVTPAPTTIAPGTETAVTVASTTTVPTTPASITVNTVPPSLALNYIIKT